MDGRAAWWVIAAVFFLFFAVTPLVNFVWTLATGPTLPQVVGAVLGLAVSALFAFYLVGGSYRRARR